MSAVARIFPDKAEIGVVEGVMSGEPVFIGTRIPVETSLIYIARGSSAGVIYEDYPTLPPGSIEAATLWAQKELGPDWRSRIGRFCFLT